MEALWVLEVPGKLMESRGSHILRACVAPAEHSGFPKMWDPRGDLANFRDHPSPTGSGSILLDSYNATHRERWQLPLEDVTSLEGVYTCIYNVAVVQGSAA